MKYILAQLSERFPDGLWERQNVVAVQAGDRFIRAGTVGQGDILGCYKGRFIELEVKTPEGKQSPAQVTRETNVRRAGGIYAVVRSPQEAFAAIEKT